MFGMNPLKRHLFVDLEETLIDNWDAANLGPKNRVMDLLKIFFNHSPTGPRLDATVWSFAVWNERDAADFERRMRKWLEDVFNLNFVRVVTCEEMRKAICQLKRLSHLDQTEMSQLWGKDRALEDWVKLHMSDFAHTEVVLLDDMVMRKLVRFEDANVQVRFVKV